MTDTNKNEDQVINPDGADLDGTTEIERQQDERNQRTIAANPPVPTTDTRGHAETVE